MKRYKCLFHQIADFDNLWLAAKKAEKGKRFQPNVARFNFNLEANLLRLQEELNFQRYQPGPYGEFYVHEPKKRMISAAPYRDRVVHHALCNIVEPILDRQLIHDTYANRKGKGTHQAILRYQEYSKKYPYVLKCDIRKYFPSIDHQILKDAIFRKIACKPTQKLISLIIDNSNEQEGYMHYFDGDDLFTPLYRRKGLPIGNLTSQLFANFYLNPFDQFVKRELRVKGYVRYVDDFVLFASDKPSLHRYQQEIADFLANELRLLIHPNKNSIHPVRCGVDFLGFKVYPSKKFVQKSSSLRYRRKLRKGIDRGSFSAKDVDASLNSWLGHAGFGDSDLLQSSILRMLADKGFSLLKTERSSWRA